MRERWAAIAPGRAGHVAAVGFDAESGQLTLCPESAAWAAEARLEQARIIRDANHAAGRPAVRALRILASGPARRARARRVAPRDGCRHHRDRSPWRRPVTLICS
ncbi:DciA family protein [Streptomyces morookaense]|uniref:DciA family protein n=1 Tax=Streptomyces morookaense TaxID=1970 RepID=UPI00159DE4D3|nr:DciA family protein [Streptomyces morookaense]